MESWNFGVGRGLKTNLVFVAVREIMEPGGSVNWEEMSRISDPSFRKFLSSFHGKSYFHLLRGLMRKMFTIFIGCRKEEKTACHMASPTTPVSKRGNGLMMRS